MFQDLLPKVIIAKDTALSNVSQLPEKSQSGIRPLNF